MTFVLTPLAEADLAEIADYVADEASADRAEAVVLEVMAAAGRLADMPCMGHSRTRSQKRFGSPVPPIDAEYALIASVRPSPVAAG